MSLDSVTKIIEFAISREREAELFYRDLASRMNEPHISQLFEDYAREEAGHRQKIEEIKEGKLLIQDSQRIQDLKIADYIVEAKEDGILSYQDALILAMKREKASFRFYSDLSARAGDATLKKVFLMLAQEEAKHKLRLELEYDDRILLQN